MRERAWKKEENLLEDAEPSGIRNVGDEERTSALLTSLLWIEGSATRIYTEKKLARLIESIKYCSLQLRSARCIEYFKSKCL